MTFQEKQKKNKKYNSHENIIKIIKKNLSKENFTSHTKIIKFLQEKDIYITQPTLSRLLSRNMIEKDKNGIYIDVEDKIKKDYIKIILNKLNAKIEKPVICNYKINKKTNDTPFTPSMYSVYIISDMGYENFLYEVISDYIGKNNFIYTVGKGHIQIISNKINLLILMRKKLISIQNME